MRYWRLPLLCFSIACLSAISARAADPQAYKVEFERIGDSDIDSTLKATSDLEALRSSAPVSPFGLIARARSDVDRLTTVLESYGYYECRIVIKIDGVLVSDPTLGDLLTALPKGSDAKVVISFLTGAIYHLGRIDIDGELPAGIDARSIMGLSTGQTAVAQNVLTGAARLLTVLQEDGYAFAKVDPPVAYEAADAPVLDLKFQVSAGNKVKIGGIRIEGLQRVHERLLRSRLLLHTGDQYRPSAIERARRDLLALNVFGQVSVQVGTEADDTGGVPVTFKIRERARHAVTVSAAYSSDLGGSGGVTWTDRNVFGNAEQLSLAASVINLGGSDTTGIGYDTSAKLLIPEFGHRDQSLQFAVGAIKQSLQAYDQTSRSTSVTLSRKLSSIWTVSMGLAVSDEQIIQEDVDHNYTLIALPLIASYDSTNLASPLEDPRHGYRGALSVAPTVAFGKPTATFLITQAKLAGYFDLSGLVSSSPGRTVLAARALAGIAAGASEFSLPPDQRFYAGGSGTVRGYQYQYVGPLFPNDATPIGGTAITSAGLELRQRFGTNFGAAFFVDAGQVSEHLKFVPDDLRVGVGAGVRYYTPIGPVRFDIAVPTSRRSVESRSIRLGPDNATVPFQIYRDSPFQIYIGLGQAF